jgi:replicative DNA helicase
MQEFTTGYNAQKQISKNLSFKELPASYDAEKAILGAVLLEGTYFERIGDELKALDFYFPVHQFIFNAMISVYKKNSKIDSILLKDELIIMGKLEEIGNIEYLIQLQEDFSVLAFFDQYIELVKEKSILRQIINASLNIVSACYSQEEQSVLHVIDQAEKILFDISSRRTKHSYVQLDLWLKKTFQQLASIQSGTKGVTGIQSGFSVLDNMTSGFQEGDLIILAARPSVGKTALALCMARNATFNNAAVGIISLEMSAEQLVLRMLACESRIKLSSIRNGTMNSDDWLMLTQSAASLSEVKMFIDDTPMQTILDIRTKARKLKAESNISILFVDYLQLLNSNRRHENRHHEVSEISRFLKGLAKELKIPIVALSQLSRSVESRVDKRPILSDLRDSGAIEQDADIILFLYRDIVYNPQAEDPTLSELIVGKQRNGPTGTVYLTYNRDYTMFENRG